MASSGWGSWRGADRRLQPQAEAAFQPLLRVPEDTVLALGEAGHFISKHTSWLSASELGPRWAALALLVSWGRSRMKRPVGEPQVHPGRQHQGNSTRACLLGSHSFENLLYSPSGFLCFFFFFNFQNTVTVCEEET